MDLPCLQCGEKEAKEIGDYPAFFCSAQCGAVWALEAINGTNPPLHVLCSSCKERWSKVGMLKCEVCEPPPPPRRPEKRIIPVTRQTVPPFVCPKCGKRLGNRGGLGKHVLTCIGRKRR